MKYFNAFQLAVIFCLYPFAIEWVTTKSFTGAGAVFYVLCIAYIAHFIITVIAYAELSDKL